MARIDGLKDEFGRFMQAWTLYPLLKEAGLMQAESRLSPEGGECEVNGVSILVIPEDVARASARYLKRNFVHRVLARCDCGRDIPFGKLGQHRKSCRASVPRLTFSSHRMT
jgi:hypothetical protein